MNDHSLLRYSSPCTSLITTGSSSESGNWGRRDDDRKRVIDREKDHLLLYMQIDDEVNSTTREVHVSSIGKQMALSHRML